MSEANGTAPAEQPPADQPAAPAVSGGERLMMIFVIAACIGLALIAIDLGTGGKAWDQFRSPPAVPQEA